MGALNNSTVSKVVFAAQSVKPDADEQIENGEQPLQSLLRSEPEVRSVCSSSSHLSKMEQGTTALKRM
jgi:hypothetical protein